MYVKESERGRGWSGGGRTVCYLPTTPGNALTRDALCTLMDSRIRPTISAVACCQVIAKSSEWWIRRTLMDAEIH